MRTFRLISALALVGGLAACKSLPGALGGSDEGGEHLVDYKEFDPTAGVAWAEPSKAKAEDLKKAHPIFLIDVTVIDGTGGPAKPHMDVLIDKGRIAEIAPTGDIVPPKGTEKLKATGATAMPGLVDAMAFASAGGGPQWQDGFVDERRNLEANLYAGVTTMFVGGDADKLAELRDKAKKGALLPQLYLVAPMVTVKNGYPSELAHQSALGKLGGGGGAAVEVLNPSDAKAKINSLADAKAKFDVIPIVYDATPAGFPKISQESLRVCIDRTHTRGRKAFVFTGTLEEVTHALANKADAVVHGVYEEGLDEEKAGKLSTILQNSNSFYFAPALAELWGKAYAVSGQSFPAVALEKDTADADTLSAFTSVPKKTEGMLYKYAQAVGPQVPVAADNLKKLAGVKTEGGQLPLVATSTAAGPGLFPGAALHREMMLMVKAGVPAVQAVAAATSRPARLIREDKADFGLLEPGKRADVLVVDGDVTADITNTQRIRHVILNGRLVDRVPLGKWEEHQKAKEATPAAEAPKEKGAAEEKTTPAGATIKKKKKKSTGADEDPTPIGE